MLGAGSLVGATVGDEVYFNRSLLRSIGALALRSGVGPEAATYRSGFWVISQGLLSSATTT
jgi:hypothetical protein